MHVRTRFLQVGEAIAVQFAAQELPLVGTLLDWDEACLCVLIEDGRHVIPWSAVQHVVHDPHVGRLPRMNDPEVLP